MRKYTRTEIIRNRILAGVATAAIGTAAFFGVVSGTKALMAMNEDTIKYDVEEIKVSEAEPDVKSDGNLYFNLDGLGYYVAPDYDGNGLANQTELEAGREVNSEEEMLINAGEIEIQETPENLGGEITEFIAQAPEVDMDSLGK